MALPAASLKTTLSIFFPSLAAEGSPSARMAAGLRPAVRIVSTTRWALRKPVRCMDLPLKNPHGVVQPTAGQRGYLIQPRRVSKVLRTQLPHPASVPHAQVCERVGWAEHGC